MKLFDFHGVDLKEGYLFDKEKLNREITINAVYDRFKETGRFDAFLCNWREDMPNKPDLFWDSDVAKWIEGAANIIKKYPSKDLEDKIEEVIDCIEKFQGPDGYFNIYFTVIEPSKRYKNRNWHELYCAGHLFEAAVAYAEATGKERFLNLMEKYADYIHKVFVEEESASFHTPGHEEIELALVRMYEYTKKKKFLDLAAFFINERGTEKDFCGEENINYGYCQAHMPCRDQREAIGHSVRAMYLYCGMADIAYETNDEELKKACYALFENVTQKKMYVTGGIGSTYIGETFTKAYDLPNDEAYTETCASIGLMFFAHRMMRFSNDSKFADIIERAFYNGVMSGISVSGNFFFYENPLEISMQSHSGNVWGEKRYPITQRVECFQCSCCPPNLNRLLSSLGNYIFGYENDTLYVNQFASCSLKEDGITAEMTANYPASGKVSVKANGVSKVAIRIPSWCDNFKTDLPYEMAQGYAVFANGGEIAIEFDMTPFTIRANVNVERDAGKLCVQAGPIVYCAEEVDNGANLHALSIDTNFTYNFEYDEKTGLNNLVIDGYRMENTSENLYVKADKEPLIKKPVKIKLIPYSTFANRGETDMLTWFVSER